MLYDRDIREPLFAYLEETFGKIRILEEKAMGRSRADVVMVTEDGLVGIEIKSDADSYERLARQVADYDRYYDRNLCVIGVSHVQHIEEHLPPHWGILTAEALEDGSLDFYMARQARPNPDISEELRMSLLWRPELNRLLERNGLPRYADKSKKFVIGQLLARVHPDDLRWQACQELFERDYNTIAEEINAWRVSHGERPRGKKKKRGRRK